MRRFGGLFCAFLAAGCALSGAARAQDYPSKPIRIVVPFPAGGTSDILARAIGRRMTEEWKQPVIVDNRPGAGANIGAEIVVKSPPDGHTLLLCTHFESINVVMYRNPGFKLSDLAPISLISKYYYGLTLSPAIPADTFEDFLAYARTHPGGVSYATIGSGSAQEILARQLEVLAGIRMTKIPYRSGTQVVQDMIGGRVHFYVAPTLAVMPYHENRQLKVLAVSSPERLKTAPHVPSLKEKGIDFVRFGWLGICAPAGTPKPIIDLLNRHIVSIVETPEYRTLIENGGSIPGASTPEDLGRILVQTVEEVASTIKEFGMQQD
ncbi:MAG: tripartite tricarboxylate transporter substrate binding protein [Dehalococcoidia bacterium]|nr:tripartite tricarboxylate transporter substrate binding protein [Dehalococcoidia bacterium]